MKQSKKWYDYLWIFSTIYLALGFFNILFAWLGMICFITPLAISIIKGNKAYCNKYCGRGQLFALLGGKIRSFPKQEYAEMDALAVFPLRISRIFPYDVRYYDL